MSLEITLEKTNALLADILAKLCEPAASAGKEKPSATQKKEKPPKTPTGAEKCKEPAAEAEKQEASEKAAAPNYTETGAWVTRVLHERGRDVAAALLANFGAANLPGVDPARFTDVIAACKAELGE